MRTILFALIISILLVGCTTTATPYSQVQTGHTSECLNLITITDVVGVKILNQEPRNYETVLVILVKDNPDNTAWRVINLYADSTQITFQQQPNPEQLSTVSFCGVAVDTCDDGECYGDHVVVLAQNGLASIH